MNPVVLNVGSCPINYSVMNLRKIKKRMENAKENNRYSGRNPKQT
jgi:hypothetical protein